METIGVQTQAAVVSSSDVRVSDEYDGENYTDGSGNASEAPLVRRPVSKSKSLDVDNLRFILECFFLSFGPECPQLGRYHPSSDPERYASEWQPSDVIVSTKTAGCGDAPPTSDARPGTTTSALPLPLNADDLQRQTSLNGVFFPDDLILRELSEMRALLHRLLVDHQDAGHENNDLLEVLDFLPDSGPIPEEPVPHFPVGSWGLRECGICLETRWLYLRPCCNFPACSQCLKKYYTSKVAQMQLKIECCNVGCKQYVHRDEISARLPQDIKKQFHNLIESASLASKSKTCPHCNHVSQKPGSPPHRSWTHWTLKKTPKEPVVCPSCGLSWCFSCHSPWHDGMTCREFRKGDRLLRSWAKSVSHGQVNAQKCPRCKIFIQRTSGCDHMHCARCKTHFCYRCGDRFRQLKFFGDHYSKLSIFGCKFRYKADKPVQRKVIRGAVFGGKLAAAPLIGLLALCAGVIVVGVGVFAFPLYGGMRLVRKYDSRKKSVDLRAEPIGQRVWVA
ncbi:E3 ubiquitin-protein ligase RNF217-like [Ornithodoros turicata]|uniref:E3 ubiquitin-protein ligase RNF217-like n=1 Tax=Ornithodoros turicata TaxID=34597 RepID=UPI003139805A